MPSTQVPPPPRLTPRQLEVLELMARGLPNREIADALEIAPATVKRHVSAVIEALDVTNRTEAATALHELGLGAEPPGAVAAQGVAGFGGRPAIAVLPFDNLSSDPEQEYLADGIVEDLITRLAAWRWFPVIARNSTFVYKGRAVDVTEASRALGARYVLEGSVRRVGGRVRITAQLIDGETGRHVWADRYDRELKQVFALEDEIVDGLVAALEPALLRIEALRALPQPARDLGAWECLQRGLHHVFQLRLDALEEALPCLERAAELDPGMSQAWAFQGYVELQRFVANRARDVDAAAARILELAQRAVRVDASDPIAQLALGWGWVLSGEPARGADAHERSLELDPSGAWAHVGLAAALGAMGGERLEDALAASQRAARLSPRDPLLHFILFFAGVACMQLLRFDDGFSWLEKSRRLAPDQPHVYPMLASCHVMRGNLPEAQAAVARMVEIDPHYSPAVPARVFAAPEILPVYLQSLEAAGWKEGRS